MPAAPRSTPALHYPDTPDTVSNLLHALQRAGAEQQAKTLLARLPAYGWFDFFREQAGHEIQYRFGREIDGSPAPPWGWDNLD